MSNLTKTQIQDKLDKAGVEYDESAKKADLEALLEEVKEKKVDEDEAPEETEDEVDDANESEEDEAPAKTSPRDSVDVIQRDRIYVRTYSKAVHGKDYQKLAEQFVTKEMYATRGYTLLPSDKVKEVEVRYREKEDAELHPDKQKLDSPEVDKAKRFTDKEAAIRFCIQKHGTIIIVAKSDK